MSKSYMPLRRFQEDINMALLEKMPSDLTVQDLIKVGLFTNECQAHYYRKHNVGLKYIKLTHGVRYRKSDVYSFIAHLPLRKHLHAAQAIIAESYNRKACPDKRYKEDINVELLDKMGDVLNAADLIRLGIFTGTYQAAQYRDNGRGPKWHKVGALTIYYKEDVVNFINKLPSLQDDEETPKPVEPALPEHVEPPCTEPMDTVTFDYDTLQGSLNKIKEALSILESFQINKPTMEQE